MMSYCTSDYFDSVNNIEFIDKLLSGGHESKNAFHCLFQITRSRIHSFVRNHLNSDDECQEAMQDIYMAIFTHLPKFQKGSKLTTWMYSVAHHKICHTYSRRRKGHVDIMGYLESGSVSNHKPDFWSRLSPWDGPPDRVLARDLALKYIEEATEALSRSAKEVYLLRDMEGLSIEEVAKILGESHVNVRVRLFRARKQIVDSVRKRFDHTSFAEHSQESKALKTPMYLLRNNSFLEKEVKC